MVTKTPVHFTITARGHENICATHQSTFELTTESHLSLQGDCIIGVETTHSVAMLNQIFGDALRSPGSRVYTQLAIGKVTEQIQGYGSPQLQLSDPTSIVWRKSNFIDERTIAIGCNKAAKDLNRHLIKALQTSEAILQVSLVIYPGTTRRSNTT
jgi:hypothetical protein